MAFHCSGEFGDENIEADSIEDAALICARAHAGLECDKVCYESWSLSVNGVVFFAEVVNGDIVLSGG